MEALVVERPHTPITKPHGEKAHESMFFFHWGFVQCRYPNNYSLGPQIH